MSIVMLSFNAPYWTDRCLRSLFRRTRLAYELIIVDNGSDEESLDLLHRYDGVAGLRLITNAENRGYAAANNQGMLEAKGEIVVFLNSDVIVTEGWLNNLVFALDSRPDVAAVGPRTNHASGIQGGVFLSSLESEAVDRFAAHFNWPDPNRWQETDSLSGFVLAVRRSVLDEVGGFDERFSVGTAEDRDLCTRIRALNHRLLVLGDTFVFHAGHASFLESRLNFAHQNNLNRLLLTDREGATAPPSKRAVDAVRAVPQDGVVITIEGGARYIFRAGVLHPVVARDALDILGLEEEQGVRQPDFLQEHPIAEPVFFIRSFGETVYLFAFGERHAIVGDRDRISRLRGISVLRPRDLEVIPEGEVVELPNMRPLDPYGITGRSPINAFESRVLGTDAVASRISDALDAREGLSIIRLGSGEAIVLNDGSHEVKAFKTDYSGVPAIDHEVRETLLRAIRDADIVGITPERRFDYCAPLLEKLFAHFNIAPRYVTTAFVNWDLIGVDRNTGSLTARDQLLKRLTRKRRLAVVGRLARQAYERRDELGWNVTLAADVEGFDEIDSAFALLEQHQDDFDLALVSAGIPAVVLCPRIARTLGRVAIDFGHSLNFLLNPHFSETTLIKEKLRWRLERYIAQTSESEGDPGATSELDRSFCRSSSGDVYYIEGGLRRHVPSRDLLQALGAEVTDVPDAVLENLELGLPFFLVADDLAGAFVVKDGEKVPVDFGMPWVGSTSESLAQLPTSSDALQMTVSRTATPSSRDNGQVRLIQMQGSPDVYLEMGQQRHHVASRGAVERLESVLGPVVAVNTTAYG